MSRDIGVLGLIILAVVLLLIWSGQHRHAALAMPLVQAAAPICVPPPPHWQFKQRRIA